MESLIDLVRESESFFYIDCARAYILPRSSVDFWIRGLTLISKLQLVAVLASLTCADAGVELHTCWQAPAETIVISVARGIHFALMKVDTRAREHVKG